MSNSTIFLVAPDWRNDIILRLADEVAGHSPADQLPIEKTREAPVLMFSRLYLTV